MDRIFYSLLSVPILITKSLVPYSSLGAIIIPVVGVLIITIILSFILTPYRKYFKLLIFIYFLFVSVLLIYQGIKPRPPEDIISSDLRENRNYAITICLSCIGIE
ncbi:MAG: hypothetical protein APR63_04160 [Desulfuromonas sp. SDB]|nr:MAG: hypothetical protein APR63_04160 [Desulfuromonas sp. SDB]